MCEIIDDVLIIGQHYYNNDPVIIDWNQFNYIRLDNSKTSSISIRIKFKNIQNHKFILPNKVINTISFLNFNGRNLVYSYGVKDCHFNVSLTLKGCVTYPKQIIMYDIPNVAINLAETTYSYINRISWYIKYSDLIKLSPYINKKSLPECIISQLGTNSVLKYEINANIMKFSESCGLLIDYEGNSNKTLFDSRGEIRLI